MRLLLSSAFMASALLVGSVSAFAQSDRPLPVQNVSSYVDFVPVLPGDRFALNAENFQGHSVRSAWSASGGKVVNGTWQAPTKPGAYKLEGKAFLAGEPISRTLWMLVTVPTARVLKGHLNGYPIGTYPKGTSTGPLTASRGMRPVDSLPQGFIELTKNTAGVPLSAHYTVGDFQGKDDFVLGCKYLFIQPKIVEKLERLIDTLHSAGYSVDKLKLMAPTVHPNSTRRLAT
jgi:hypothetical protein